MGIHLPTIVVIIAISSVLNFFMLLAQYLLNRKFTGVLYWLFGFAILALSQFILYGDDTVPNAGLNSISDVLLVTGFITVLAGIKIFFNVHLPKRTFIALILLQLVSALAFFFHKNVNVEQVCLFAILGYICIVYARDFYRHHKVRKSPTALFSMSLFILYACLFFIEGAIDLWHIKALQTAPPPEMLLLIYGLSFIMVTLTPFSFVMLVNHELIGERQQALDELKRSETKYRQDSTFLLSVLESPQDIIIFSLDNNYCYTKFTSFHRAVMKKIWGADIETGTNMLDIILSPADRQKAKLNFDRALRGEFFVEEENYGDEKLYRAFYENRYSPIKNLEGEIIGLSVFVIDITERKKAEEEIQNVKNHFETLFKISPDATLITKLPGGEIVDVNEAFLAGTGFSREEAIGRSTMALGLWANTADRELFVQTMMANGIFLNFEVDFVKKDGTANPGSISAKAYNVNGVTYILSITHSLAERKKREEALHLAQYAISQSTDAVFWVRENGSFYDVNHSAEQLLGYSREELLCLSVPQINPSFAGVRWDNHWQQIKLKKNIIVSTSQVKKDGSRIFTEVNANYINYNGIELLCSFVKDVTERTRAEQEKEKIKRNFDALINSTSDLMWSVDRDYKLIAGNEAFIQIMHGHISFDLKTGDPILDEVHFDKAFIQYWKELYDQAFSGKDFLVEINYKRPNDDGIWWSEFHLNPIWNGTEITGVACFGKDITARKEQERVMTELNNQIKLRAEELSASNRELEQFAYIASHDLQEPLRMVSSFLKLLEKKYQDKLDNKGLQFINFAVDGSTRMQQIILDLLEYSRVGKSERPAEIVDLNELMNDIIHVNGIAIEEHKALISWHNLPTLQTVKLSLQQVLQNLVTNALKYHQPGVPPVITVTATELDEFWQIEVKDNGIGIEPAFFSKIFVVFQRLHTNESYQGTGIGLSICKKIIDKQGGTIWVESEPGKGSSFYFTIKKT